jgi:hypothetical protein
VPATETTPAPLVLPEPEAVLPPPAGGPPDGPTDKK